MRELLQIVGLVLAGGLLLLWVAWKMWRELRHKGESAGSQEIAGDEHSALHAALSSATLPLAMPGISEDGALEQGSIAHVRACSSPGGCGAAKVPSCSPRPSTA